MKIIKADQKADGIYVEAELDVEIRNHAFPLDMSADEIKTELEKCEATIKLEKEQWAANAELDAANEKASKTVELLTKKQ